LAARFDQAMLVANIYNLSQFNVESRFFNLTGFSKKIIKKTPITVYVEGDGFAWVTRSLISKNPTPTKPMLLRLAGLDPKRNVIYLARPCQYVTLKLEKNCNSKYWTSHRYSEEVVFTYLKVLDVIQKKYNTTGFHLVGFSGGGAITSLLASRRNDVLSLRTIAGNLDHVTLNTEKRVSQLTGSINPIDEAKRLENIPQIHFVGTKDEVIPSWVARSFVKTVGEGPCVRTKVVLGTSHLDGWSEVWKKLSLINPLCNGAVFQ
jgi:hypothetical protein